MYGTILLYMISGCLRTGHLCCKLGLARIDSVMSRAQTRLPEIQALARRLPLIHAWTTPALFGTHLPEYARGFRL